MTVDEMIRLMEAMRVHSVALVEHDGSKLALQPGSAPRPSPSTAPAPLEPRQAIAQARIVAATRRDRLQEERMTRAARRMGADLGPQTGQSLGKLMEDVVEQAASAAPETGSGEADET